MFSYRGSFKLGEGYSTSPAPIHFLGARCQRLPTGVIKEV